MYKIALVCEHGASTGLCVQKMIAAAQAAGIDAEIGAYSFSQLDNLVDRMDVLLVGPQLAYKLATFKSAYPAHADKLSVINPMDFGMMDGAKILREAMEQVDRK